MNEPKAVVLLSGGMDSATVLAWALQNKWNVVCALAIYYGQRHMRELEAARSIAQHFVVPYESMPVPVLQSPALSSQSRQGVPDASAGLQYLTNVYGRNAVLCAHAAALAQARGASVVMFGACADDYRSYPDCRQPFIDALNVAFTLGYGVSVVAPFVTWSKTRIVTNGLAAGVPFALTYTCYRGGERPCMACDACVERVEAMEANGVDYFGRKA